MSGAGIWDIGSACVLSGSHTMAWAQRLELVLCQGVLLGPQGAGNLGEFPHSSSCKNADAAPPPVAMATEQDVGSAQEREPGSPAWCLMSEDLGPHPKPCPQWALHGGLEEKLPPPVLYAPALTPKAPGSRADPHLAPGPRSPPSVSCEGASPRGGPPIACHEPRSHSHPIATEDSGGRPPTSAWMPPSPSLRPPTLSHMNRV